MIVLSRAHASDRRSLLLEYWVLHVIFHLCVLDESLHAVAHVVHFEDFSSRRSVGGILSHEFDDELFQLRAVGIRDRLWLVLHDLEDETEQVVRLERLLQRAELVQDDAERPHVTLRRVRHALARLRRHVVRRADHSHCDLRR